MIEPIRRDLPERRGLHIEPVPFRARHRFTAIWISLPMMFAAVCFASTRHVDLGFAVLGVGMALFWFGVW